MSDTHIYIKKPMKESLNNKKILLKLILNTRKTRKRESIAGSKNIGKKQKFHNLADFTKKNYTNHIKIIQINFPTRDILSRVLIIIGCTRG